MTQLTTPPSTYISACNIHQLSLEFPNKTMFCELQFNLVQRQISACIGFMVKPLLMHLALLHCIKLLSGLTLAAQVLKILIWLKITGTCPRSGKLN